VFKKLLSITGVLLLVSGLCVTNSFAASGSKSITPVSSVAQLQGLLAKAIKQQKLPNDLVPSMTQLANDNDGIQGYIYLHPSCDPYNATSEGKNPAPCWYGDPNSKRTVVIFGDSFVGNWIPALDVAGKALGFKVAEFSFIGCNTAFVSPSGPATGFDQNEVDACISFHENLPRSVNKLDPIAVIAADGAPDWGAQSDPSWISGLDEAFNEMSTSTDHPVRILLGTGPHLTEPAPSCMASHPSSINRCNFTYTPGSNFGEALSRDEASIQGANLNLIPTYQWMCLRNICPVVIGNIDVYADTDHLTVAFSKYLSVLLEKSLAPLLSSATS
jgi:hypothetical protein